MANNLYYYKIERTSKCVNVNANIRKNAIVAFGATFGEVSTAMTLSAQCPLVSSMIHRSTRVSLFSSSTFTGMKKKKYIRCITRETLCHHGPARLTQKATSTRQ